MREANGAPRGSALGALLDVVQAEIRQERFEFAALGVRQSASDQVGERRGRIDGQLRLVQAALDLLGGRIRDEAHRLPGLGREQGDAGQDDGRRVDPFARGCWVGHASPAPPARYPPAGAGTGRRICKTTTAATIEAAIRSGPGAGETSASPATVSRTRSSTVVRRSSQPLAAAARAPSPSTAVTVTLATSSQYFVSSSSPNPAGCTVNMKGTTKAGSVYFQACSMVLKALPPVSAAAAMGERPTGGETSERTA